MDTPSTSPADCPADLAPRMPTKYLRDFFAEKDLPTVHWELQDKGGTPHFISNLTVLEFVQGVGRREAADISGIIRRIDYHNGNVNVFLKDLAGILINR